ncbi:Hsp20/alpha crystallin family protein [Maricurvus nonylphenolicus]|uniref:Hsp20/alpha crystallin family protein n=1 Tax=Maricurvus nonylphenolicus TaxID=1008307 RepID=UPI0036F22EFF
MMKTQEVWDFMRQEWNQAVHGLADQWNHFRQRMNHALVHFKDKDAAAQEKHQTWGVVPVCMKERGDKLMINVEIPGVEQDQLSVTLDNHALMIRGEKQATEEWHSEDGRWHIMETAYGEFERRIPLPHRSVGAGDIEAKYKNGILTIEVPLKEQPEVPPREISIH